MTKKTEVTLPKYPVYVISKGRPTSITAKFLIEDGTPFKLVIEPQDLEAYTENFDPSLILVLPFANLGQGSIPARNWVWEHSKAAGHARHWILDDNIAAIWRRWKSVRVRCPSGIAFAAVEDFVDQYENIAIGGMNYTTFCHNNNRTPAFYLNCHVYSTLLIKNDLPFRWRGRYNEDTDLCLQVLSNDWCTINTNVFLIEKRVTLSMAGGNSEIYKGDGRLKMARALERMWPGVVSVRRKFGRAQHVVKNSWRDFKTPLRKIPDAPKPSRDYSMKLTAVKPPKSNRVAKLVKENT